MSDDDKAQASPPEAAGPQPPTQGFPAYQPPPPAEYPPAPQWAAQAPPAPIVVRLSRRDHALVALSTVVALILVLGIPALFGFRWMRDGVATIQQLAGDSNGAAAPAASGGVDLRQGAVFMASNDARNNEVIAFSRAGDGKLTEVGRYATGGTGSGSYEDVAEPLVLGTSEAEASPNQYGDAAELLFVVNAGSNSISVFRVNADGLEMVSKVPSGGEKPISLAISKGLLYVLNSGEFDDRLILQQPPESADAVLENCGHGQVPQVTGFRVAPDGALTQIDGSSRLLSGVHPSGCASIGFSRDGKTLVATERIAGTFDEATGFGKGAILAYGVRPDGTLAPPVITEPTGNGPYGFTFTEDNVLLSTEQNGAHSNPGGGHVTSYKLNDDRTLTPLSGSIPNGQTDTCWIVLTDDQKIAFTSSPFGGGRISSFTVDTNGVMALRHPVASAPDGMNPDNDGTVDGLLDISLSRDNKYLYVVTLDGAINSFKVNDNATLTPMEKFDVVTLKPLGEGGEGGPMGIAVF
jgi:6-phosphogluconolactonase